MDTGREAEVKPIEALENVDAKRLRLKNWVNESPHVLGAKKARQIIADNMYRDLGISQQALPLLAPEVQRLTAKTIKYLEGRKDAEQVSKQHNEDQTVFTEIVRDDNAWIAREVRRVGEEITLISQARIGSQGETRLTLTYDDPKHIDNNANPNLNDVENLPRATAVMFNLLVNSIKEQSAANKLLARFRK
jgi:hypothetical protein